MTTSEKHITEITTIGDPNRRYISNIDGKTYVASEESSALVVFDAHTCAQISEDTSDSYQSVIERHPDFSMPRKPVRELTRDRLTAIICAFLIVSILGFIINEVGQISASKQENPPLITSRDIPAAPARTF